MLEPSFGEGDFLLAAIERLLDAWKTATGGKDDPVAALADCIRGVELHRATFTRTRLKVVELLELKGVAAEAAARFADHWLIHGDFLLALLPGSFDVVVGNPPYVRQELIPDALIAEYRARLPDDLRPS